MLVKTDFLGSWLVSNRFSGVWFLTVLQILVPWLSVFALLRGRK
jgi:hypothetical protein